MQEEVIEATEAVNAVGSSTSIEEITRFLQVINGVPPFDVTTPTL